MTVTDESGEPARADPLPVDLEGFGALIPCLNPLLFLEHGRVALAAHHRSPAAFKWTGPDREILALVAFNNPDPRSSDSIQRPDFVEYGAIPMAVLLLWEFEKKRIRRVTKRGSRVDYFIGELEEEFYWIMEISGTDQQGLRQRMSEKREQLMESYHLVSPECRGGYISVTRFARPAESVLERFPKEGGT